jgi:hypothetical protein
VLACHSDFGCMLSHCLHCPWSCTVAWADAARNASIASIALEYKPMTQEVWDTPACSLCWPCMFCASCRWRVVLVLRPNAAPCTHHTTHTSSSSCHSWPGMSRLSCVSITPPFHTPSHCRGMSMLLSIAASSTCRPMWVLSMQLSLRVLLWRCTVCVCMSGGTAATTM